jgi:hypothetical protein
LGQPIPPAVWGWGVGLLFAPLAAALVASQLFHTNTLRFDGFSLARVLHGTDARPYAFRVMTGWLVRLVLACGLQHLPLPYLDGVVAKTCPAIAAATGTACGAVKAYALVALLCAWGFLAATYVAALRVVGGVVWGLAAVLIACLTVNAILLQGYGHLYDFPVLLTATLLFLLAMDQRHAAFLAVFAIACLVKESLAIFALVYVLIGFPRDHGRAITRFILHSLVFTAIYGWERIHFADNMGLPFYHYGARHLRYLLDTATLPAVLLLLLAIALLVYRLPSKHPALRQAMLVLPLMMIAYFAGGNPGEFRIAFDVFPILLLPVVDTMRQIISES